MKLSSPKIKALIAGWITQDTLNKMSEMFAERPNLTGIEWKRDKKERLKDDMFPCVRDYTSYEYLIDVDGILEKDFIPATVIGFGPITRRSPAMMTQVLAKRFDLRLSQTQPTKRSCHGR